MPVTLTPIVYTLRLGPAHHAYGDPYDAVATVIRIGSVGYVEGWCCRPPTNAERREIAERGRAEGMHTVIWTRKREAGDHEARLGI